MKLSLRRKARDGARTKLPSAWKLYKESLSSFRSGWKGYTKIIAIVAIPGNLLSAITGQTGDGSVIASYISFTSIVMYVTFLWAAIWQEKTGKVPRLRRAYYDASVALVRFMITAIIVIIMLIPAAIGLMIYEFAVSASSVGVSISAGEQILFSLLALLIASPSIFLSARYGFSLIAVVRDGLAPGAALRRSWGITRKHFWAIFLRAFALVVISIFFALPILVITFGLALLKWYTVSSIFMLLAVTFTILPVAYLYGVRLYHYLDAGSGRTHGEDA